MPEADAEERLVEQAVSGHAPALEQLLWQYYGALEQHIAHKIPSNARKHFGPEDILQTAFTHAFRDIRQFTPRGQGAFYAWLRTIADHRLIDALRKLNHGGMQQLSIVGADSDQSMHDLIALVCANDDSPSCVAANKEAIQAMQIALASLPDDQREAVRLNCLEHRSIEEIAVIIERTEAAVRGLVHRGKKNLRDAMGRSSRWYTGT